MGHQFGNHCRVSAKRTLSCNASHVYQSSDTGKDMFSDFFRYINTNYRTNKSSEICMSVLYTKLEKEVKLILVNKTINLPLISGPTYIWTFNLKSKERPSKWVLAGVALLLQI